MTLESAPTSVGRLVSLRPTSRPDYLTLFRWRSSFDTIHMLNFRRRMSSFEDFSLELDYVLTNGILLLVVDNSSQRPVGYVVAHNVNPWDGWASVGMYVEPQLRGRGHGGEAALLAVDSFFRIFPLRK